VCATVIAAREEEAATVAPAAAAAGPRRSARSLLWALLESGGLALTSFVTLVVFARLLSPHDLGTAALALSFVQLLNLPVEVLFQDALVQRRDVRAHHFDTAFTVSLALGAGLCALCWLSAGPIGAVIGDPRAGTVLGYMSLSLPASGLASALVARHRRELRFRALAVRSLLGRLAGAFAAIALALLGAGVWAPVVQQVVSVALGAVLIWLATPGPERPRLGLGAAEFRELFAFGIGAVGANAFTMLIPRAFLLQIGVVLGTEAAGYANLAFRTVDTLRDLAVAAIWRVAFPVFSRAARTQRLLRWAFAGSIELTAAVAFPAFVGRAAIAPEVIAQVYGARWAPALPFVVVLCGLALVYLVRIYAWASLYALGRPLDMVPGQLVEAAVVLAWPLLGPVTTSAAALAWALRAVLAVPADEWMLRRASGLSMWAQLRGMSAPTVASAGMAGAVLALGAALPVALPGAVRLALLVAGGGAAYAVLLPLVGCGLARRLWDLVSTALFPHRRRR
jgi:O-antigen/teichoic acid export membrane protein